MTTGWPQNLVLDLAMAVASQDELCAIYEITEAQLAEWKRHPLFQKQVLQTREELKTTGKTFVVKARAIAEELLEDVYLIAKDETTPALVRLKAVENAVRWAGYEAKKESDDSRAPTDTRPTINITIQQPPAVVVNEKSVRPVIEVEKD